jgi:hypothetical protein
VTRQAEPAGAGLELEEQFGERWRIDRDAVLDIYSADRRSGPEIRFVVARSPEELAARLAVIEAGE